MPDNDAIHQRIDDAVQAVALACNALRDAEYGFASDLVRLAAIKEIQAEAEKLRQSLHDIVWAMDARDALVEDVLNTDMFNDQSGKESL